MKKYELMYILKADLDEAALEAEQNKLEAIFTSRGGKVTKTGGWGLRTLAYEIKKQTKGYYVVWKVEADVDTLKEFDRLTKINNNVLRYLITVDKD